VIGTFALDLSLPTEQGAIVVLRGVKALILPCKSLEKSNLVFVGASELETLGIHFLLQLRHSLQRYDESDFKEGVADDAFFSLIVKTDDSDISKKENVVLDNG
jgi:hypothetical protein